MKKSITAGIDFGNQSCVLSMPTRYGVDIVLNQSSNRKTPTIVGYNSERRFSGEFAQQQQMMNIKNTITHIKRLIGLEYYSTEREEISKYVPYTIVCLENDKLSGIQLENNTILRPEQILAYLLKSLLDIIQMKNSDIQQIVLTVPPWWTETQRRLILHTATISNVKIASLLNSTTAAAISYVKIHTDRFSDDLEKKINVLFIDIGDTSMNIAVSTLTKRKIEMKSFITEKSISGHFFTEKLNEYLIQKVQEKYKIDPKTNKRAFARFQQASEKVKKALSANPVMMFEVPSLMNDIDVSIPVKRDEFNQLFENLSEKIEYTIQKVLDESTFSKDDINAVEFLGGASRMPAIKGIIRQFFGIEPSMSLDLDECFAIGAGYMAALEDGYNIGIDVINSVYPHEIRAEYDEFDQRKTETIFRKNSIMPSNQTFSIPVIEKVSFVIVSDEVKIGCATLITGFSEKVIVEVVVSIDKFGLIDIVQASYSKKINEEEKEERVAVQFSYSPLCLLSNDEIEKFSQIEKEMSIKDGIEIEIDNTKNRLESLIFSTENELNSLPVTEDTDKLELVKIKSNVALIHSWFEENEFDRLPLDQYKQKVSEIDQQIDQVFLYKKYLEAVSFLNDLKQELILSQIVAKKNMEKIGSDSCSQFLTEISSQISEIEKITKLPKKVFIETDFAAIEKKVNEINNKIELKIKNENNKMSDQISSQNNNSEKIDDQNFKQEKDDALQEAKNETFINDSLLINSNKENDQIYSQNSNIEKGQDDENNQHQDSEKVLNEISQSYTSNQYDQISSQIPIQKSYQVHKPTQENPGTNKRRINIVNLDNDDLAKHNVSARNPALNPQKSRVKLPPMSPRAARNQHTNLRNRAARPILQNQKSGPSLVHPQSQKQSPRLAARQRTGAGQQVSQKNRRNEGKG